MLKRLSASAAPRRMCSIISQLERSRVAPVRAELFSVGAGAVERRRQIARFTGASW